MCKTETRTTGIKGVTYTKHMCPGCRTIRNPGAMAEVADLTEVHVCDHCKSVVDECPKCAGM